jgi:pyruvate dehydrogenase (quinone)
VLEAIVDPDVPPLPPHITLEQARNYLKAIIKGDRDALGIIKASVKDMLA